MNMRFSKEQLDLLRNTLLSRKMYAPTKSPCGAIIWQPYMEDLLQKIETALADLDDEQVLTTTLPTRQH